MAFGSIMNKNMMHVVVYLAPSRYTHCAKFLPECFFWTLVALKNACSELMPFLRRHLQLLRGTLVALLLKEDGVDVRENTARGDGGAAQVLIQLLVVLHGELNVTRDDTGLLVVAGSVAGKFEKLCDEVLEHSGHVDRGTGTDALSEAAFLEHAAEAANWEGEASLSGAGL